MANDNGTQALSLDALSRALWDRAKLQWVLSLGIKAVAVGLGTASVLARVTPDIAPIVMLGLAIVGEALMIFSDCAKSAAESLRRKLDAAHSLGWSISAEEILELRAEYPRLPAGSASGQPPQPYFTPRVECAPRGAVMNIQESAWWSKHLSGAMARGCWWTLAALVLLSVFLLLVSASGIGAATAVAVAGNVASSLLTLVLSLGLVRLALGYLTFKDKSARVEERARAMRRATDVDEPEAVRLMTDYHLARAVAPPIPTWLWRRNRDRLNALWADYEST